MRGVDAFRDNYPRELKLANLAALRDASSFEFTEADLAQCNPSELTRDVDVVFHLAASPGVRDSWTEAIERNLRDNVLATHRLLNACAARPQTKVIFASSSSVYGNAAERPTSENSPLSPTSPYGVSKMAAERLVAIFAESYGMRTANLRLFTVYGPRQRNDMAIQRIIAATFDRRPFALNGSGEQQRDFTFITDVVRAFTLAAEADLAPGTTLNVGAGAPATLSAVIAAIDEITGVATDLEKRPAVAGDAAHTFANNTLIATLLGWAPQVSLEAGLRMQTAWNVAQRRRE